MSETEPTASLENRPPFRPLRLILIVLCVILGISAAAQWYASQITLPRYCKNPVETLEMIRKVLTERTPAGKSGDRKPYIKAVRLTFLIPRENDEPLDDYLFRLRRHLELQCR